MASKSVTQAYSMLSERCNAMLDSKFIMANNSIAGILKLISAVPCLTNYLTKCSQNFNFDKCLSEATASSNFVLPQSNKDKVSFITKLLFMFDKKQLDLPKFIKVYYPSGDFETSYKLFCQNMITPLLLAFNGIIKEEETDTELVVNDDVPIVEAVKLQVTQYVTALIDKVINDETLSDEKRDEYLLMLDGFYYTFDFNKAKMVKVVWTGIKSVMNSYRQATSYLAAIEKILLQYAVI